MDCWWGGGGAFLRPPSNSAPELRSDMRQAAFETSSKISKKVLRSFLRSGQRSGHQRSSKSKCSRFSFRQFSTSDALPREPEELERRGKKQTIAHLQPYLECAVRFDLRSMVWPPGAKKCKNRQMCLKQVFEHNFWHNVARTIIQSPWCFYHQDASNDI